MLPATRNVLLTGAAGTIGSHVLQYLAATRHRVFATDVVQPKSPLPNGTTRITFQPADLTDYKQVDELFDKAEAHSRAGGGKLDGVIHMAAIPKPGNHDDRVVHNVNVTSSYNVLRTAAERGIQKIVQASSVNAVGLSYTPIDHVKYDKIPFTETDPYQCEDPYSLSKQICELQANSLVKLFPGTRIASLRFHMAKATYEDAWPVVEHNSFFSWVSLDACTRACLLGLDSTGWEGHEAFNIVANDICWEGPADEELRRKEIHVGDGKKDIERPTTMELIEAFYKGKIGVIDQAWFSGEGMSRRAVWDTSKAEKMLGWKHDE